MKFKYNLFILMLAAMFLSACQPVVAFTTKDTPGSTSQTGAFSTQTILPSLEIYSKITPSPSISPLLPSQTATEALKILATAIPTRIPASPTPSQPPITRILFTGVIVPARCVQAKLDEIGDPDYPYQEVQELLSGADLAVGSFNATMSDQVEHTGCVSTYQLVGSPENADALAWAGFDLMSVATNHIKDCGPMKSWCEEVFFDTLGNLTRVGIQTVGAGENLAQALQPVVITLNGIRFGFVSLGDSKLSETVFAAENHPGIARLTEENMRQAIEKARQMSDVVIALPHWGPEDEVLPNWIQRGQARYIVDAGADLVVGNHTHVVQAYQEIDGVPVFYGLGNFVFDQGWRDHRQGAILVISFEGTQYLGYELIPTHVDPDGLVHLAEAEEAAEILDRVQSASQQLN